MVTPPALIAAIPVGATTMCFYVFLTKLFRKVVLPVPAFPVRKIFREVFSTRSKKLVIHSRFKNSEKKSRCDDLKI